MDNAIASARAAEVATHSQREAPDIRRVRGWRLDQRLLLTTVLLVVVIVALMAALSSVSTQRQFEETSQTYEARLKDQTRELVQTLSRTLSLTSATSLRDNNYAFLDEVVKTILEDNKNVLRVQIFDAEGLSAADSGGTKPGTPSDRKPVRREVTGIYKGLPVFEYQEPIDYGSQAGKGIVVVSYSREPLQTQLRELEQAKRATLQRNTATTAVLGLGFMLVAAVVAAFQSRRVTRPLGALTQTVMQLAQGDLKSRVELAHGAGREVQTLGIVFNHMADRINLLLQDVRNKALLEREMQLAQKVQAALLPGKEALAMGPVRIAGACQTADSCGGDWWLRSPLGEHRVVLGIGDVTGHGLSTALVATSATSAFAAAMQMREPEEINAQMLISSLNQILFQLGRGEYQMSAALAVIDLEVGEIDYAVGAHPAPCVYNRHDGKVSSLPARGALLGSNPGSQYQARRGQLRPGDVVIWYTDGLTESRDAQGKLYGMQRLAAVLQQNGGLPVEQLRDAILADVRQFSRALPQQDDITVVITEYASA